MEQSIRRIMRRVYIYWFVRRAAPSLALYAVVAYFVIAALRQLIFVKRVLETAQNTLWSGGVYSFFVFAVDLFARAGIVKNVLLVGLAAIIFIMLRDLRRAYFVLKRQREKGIVSGFERSLRRE